MHKRSLAHAKAHLSELVDRAEHKKQPTLILRHGKPAAAIVPVETATPAVPKTMTKKELAHFFADAAACGDPDFEAVDDLLGGRR